LGLVILSLLGHVKDRGMLMKTMTSVSTFGALTEIHVNPHKLTGEWVVKKGDSKNSSVNHQVSNRKT